jgi:hypothetical protein
MPQSFRNIADHFVFDFPPFQGGERFGNLNPGASPQALTFGAFSPWPLPEPSFGLKAHNVIAQAEGLGTPPPKPIPGL